MKLNQLSDNPGARKARIRWGRGIGSGKGKTAGRGHKGQLARTGVALNGFEGGQMPIYRRLPKRGFINPFTRKPEIVNIGRIQAAIDSGALDGAQPITIDALKKAGIVGKGLDGVRLLGDGTIKAKVAIEVSTATPSAVAAVEAAGGTVKTLAVRKSAEPPKEKKKKKDKNAKKKTAAAEE
ncbi:MAG: 50S ribosomal protein L15 [Alphaproteobacteria bacterium]|nr:50S ribosomal protein L15 [Alphaproteobacteria bacterium]